MWKWILGVLAVLVILIAGTCYYGYKKLTAGGDTATVTIGGTPDRVFAALANLDSMSVWSQSGSFMSNAGHGMLKVGDTIQVSSTTTRPGGATQHSHWTVEAMVPGHLLVTQMFDDSNRVIAVRRDSLVALGDSTLLTATFSSPFMASLSKSKGDTTKSGGFVESLVVSGFRLATESDLKRLKAHIEGKAMP